MTFPPLSSSPLVANWLARHRHPASFALHLAGIPPTILGVLLIPVYLFCLSWPTFLFALGAFVGGYLLQFLGHAIEGTDPGDVIYFKRKLGWSYVEFAPGRRSGGETP
jgi:uncharacterized membrane protein YGL010W